MWKGEDFSLELCWIKFGGERENGGKKKKREEKKKEEKMSEKLHLLSRIHEDRAAGFFFRARGKVQPRDESLT